MEESDQNLNPIFESCLAFLILGCIIIGFVGNGLRIQGKTSTGLWYKTICGGLRDGCSFESLKAQFYDGKTSELTYYGEIVYWQVLVTLSLCFAGLIALFYILTLVKVIDQRKILPLVLALCIIIGGFLLLMTITVAGVFAVILGTIICSKMTFQRREACIDSNNIWRVVPFVIEFIFMLVSFLLQLAVHGGDGMDIIETRIFSITHNGTDVLFTGKMLEERFGIWYVTSCNETECTKLSRKQHNLLVNGGYDLTLDTTTAEYIELSIFMVIATGCTLVAVILYGVGLKKRTNNFTNYVRIYILACSMVVGIIGIVICATNARWQQLMNKNKFFLFYKTKQYFAWGLLLLGLSAVIDLVVALVNLIALSCRDKRTRLEYSQHVELQQIS